MKVLIIVDMQKGFMANSNKHLIGKIEKLIQERGGDLTKSLQQSL